MSHNKETYKLIKRYRDKERYKYSKTLQQMSSLFDKP